MVKKQEMIYINISKHCKVFIAKNINLCLKKYVTCVYHFPINAMHSYISLNNNITYFNFSLFQDRRAICLN